MKPYKAFLITLARETQNNININAKLSNIEQDYFLVIATTAHPTQGQGQWLSLPASELSCISFFASPSHFGTDH